MVARIIGIILGCSLLLAAACNPAPPVDYSVLTVIDSPGARRQVLVVRQDPGALGSLSTAVFVRDKGQSGLGDRVFVINGQPKLEAHWKNETRVIIAHDGKKADVYTSALTSGAVSIAYEHLPAADSPETTGR